MASKHRVGGFCTALTYLLSFPRNRGTLTVTGGRHEAQHRPFEPPAPFTWPLRARSLSRRAGVPTHLLRQRFASPSRPTAALSAAHKSPPTQPSAALQLHHHICPPAPARMTGSPVGRPPLTTEVHVGRLAARLDQTADVNPTRLREAQHEY